jgi:hypothetical protein
MKYLKLSAMGLLALVASLASTFAAGPPLTRPTPPPCCVDGVCHAHASTFGYFPTRWRVWPGLGVAPEPKIEETPVREIPGVRPFEMPPPEEEDRQAPPPTKSPAKTTTGTPAATPAGEVPVGQPTTTPLEQLGPGTGGAEGTPSPLTVPPIGIPQGATPYGRPAISTPDSSAPGTMPPTNVVPPTLPETPQTVPFESQPFSDADRPPTPPFAASGGDQPRAAQKTVRPAMAIWQSPRAAGSPASYAAQSSLRQQQSLPAPSAQGADPPPAPPFALQGPAM